jgi:hypothetical protein
VASSSIVLLMPLRMSTLFEPPMRPRAMSIAQIMGDAGDFSAGPSAVARRRGSWDLNAVSDAPLRARRAFKRNSCPVWPLERCWT